MADQQEVKHSEAKAQVAQQKPRDASGRFLSGEELQAYQAQRQQQQFEAERAKVNSMLGKKQPMQQPYPTYPTNNPIQPNMPQPRSNFQDILAANKPGARAQSPQDEGDKWDSLLGKKRQNIRW